jgi:hypothetical protein
MAMTPNETVEKPSRVLNCFFGLFDRDQRILHWREICHKHCRNAEALFLAYALGEMRAKYQSYDYAQMVMIPVSLERPLLPGTREFALHTLVQRRIGTSIGSLAMRRLAVQRMIPSFCSR